MGYQSVPECALECVKHSVFENDKMLDENRESSGEYALHSFGLLLSLYAHIVHY